VWVGDNLFEDVGWGGGEGRVFQVLSGRLPLECATIDHNTADSSKNSAGTVGDTPLVGDQFRFSNNLAPHGDYGFFGGGVGEGLAALNQYFTNWTFAKNLIPGSPSASYPADNFFPATLDDVGFVDRAGGNYRLATSSAYRSAGTDGRDVGADINAIEAATAGAE
jgi:hypothetical protein